MTCPSKNVPQKCCNRSCRVWLNTWKYCFLYTILSGCTPSYTYTTRIYDIMLPSAVRLK